MRRRDVLWRRSQQNSENKSIRCSKTPDERQIVTGNHQKADSDACQACHHQKKSPGIARILFPVHGRPDSHQKAHRNRQKSSFPVHGEPEKHLARIGISQ
jgi:hypothetical protein